MNSTKHRVTLTFTRPCHGKPWKVNVSASSYGENIKSSYVGRMDRLAAGPLDRLINGLINECDTYSNKQTEGAPCQP